jgi:hypothetical protein
VNDAPAWQLEMVFPALMARKFGVFGRWYNQRFRRHIYRNAAHEARDSGYSLPLTRDGLHDWGMSGLPVLELELLGALMRPEMRQFDRQFRRLVRQARARTSPALEVAFKVLADAGVRVDQVTVAWHGAPHPERHDTRQVLCQVSVLRHLAPSVREAFTLALMAGLQDRAALEWVPLATFDLDILRSERFVSERLTIAQFSREAANGFLPDGSNP